MLYYPSMKNIPLINAFEVCGSQAELARRLGATTPQVSEWAKGDRPIPLHRCEDIEAATDGAVTCEQLRPDVQWIRNGEGKAFYREIRDTQGAQNATA